uniref:Uncharacterized protein n=1 Tax=Arundo donax TaxID=35708 RepID=A0A0A9ACV9_ARUDO
MKEGRERLISESHYFYDNDIRLPRVRTALKTEKVDIYLLSGPFWCLLK